MQRVIALSDKIGQGVRRNLADVSTVSDDQRRLMARAAGHAGRILVVDDVAANVALLASLLVRHQDTHCSFLVPHRFYFQYFAVCSIAFSTSSICGRMASSSSGEYATGVSRPPMRMTGASRYSKSSAATRAAISAPNPHVI